MDSKSVSSTFDAPQVDGIDEDVLLELEVLNELTTFLSLLFDKHHIPEARREKVLQKYWRRMRHLDRRLQHQ